MLEGVDPVSQKEQIEMIADLKNNVIILEKELKLVHNNAQTEVNAAKV
jgi:hypothetical protein